MSEVSAQFRHAVTRQTSVTAEAIKTRHCPLCGEKLYALNWPKFYTPDRAGPTWSQWNGWAYCVGCYRRWSVFELGFPPWQARIKRTKQKALPPATNDEAEPGYSDDLTEDDIPDLSDEELERVVAE